MDLSLTSLLDLPLPALVSVVPDKNFIKTLFTQDLDLAAQQLVLVVFTLCSTHVEHSVEMIFEQHEQLHSQLLLEVMASPPPLFAQEEL